MIFARSSWDAAPRTVKVKSFSGIEFCDAYTALKTDIERLKAGREAQIEQLRQHSSAVFASHQTKINEVLGALGADFKVDNLTEKTDRRKVDPVYCGFDLVFFERHRVATEGEGEGPGIHNTLSQGDRSLLALAFFIATLWNDSSLATTIVVVDDPVSSFDRERKAGTVALLGNLRNNAGAAPEQLIILTHELGFLSELHGNRLFGGAKYLKVVPSGVSPEGCKMSDIEDCDPEEDYLKAPLIKRYEKIEKLAGSHETLPENAADDCRLLLEGLLKQKYWPQLRATARRHGGLNDFVTELHTLGLYDDAKRARFATVMDRLNHPHHASVESHTDTSGGDIRFVLRTTLELAKEV